MSPTPLLYFLMCADNVSKRARALRLIDRSIMPALVSACTRSILILLNKFINGGMRYRAAEAYIVRLIILCCVVRGSTLWFSLMWFEVGMHTVHIAMSFKYRFLWFLVSEAMLFFMECGSSCSLLCTRPTLNSLRKGAGQTQAAL